MNIDNTGPDRILGSESLSSRRPDKVRKQMLGIREEIVWREKKQTKSWTTSFRVCTKLFFSEISKHDAWIRIFTANIGGLNTYTTRFLQEKHCVLKLSSTALGISLHVKSTGVDRVTVTP